MKSNRIFRVKKIIIMFLIIILAVISAGCSFLIPKQDAKYYTPDKLKKIFESNKEQFDKVAKAVNESPWFLMQMDRFQENDARMLGEPGGDIYSSYPKASEVFSGNEQIIVERFFNEIRPSDLEKYRDTIVGIHFPQNEKGQSVDLFYIPDGVDKGIRRQYYDAFYEIGEHWWIGESHDNDASNNLHYYID